MFAPRHEVTARELARVLRPGGRLGLTAWTPEGANGLVLPDGRPYPAAAVPARPPPTLWGTEAHVAELFEGTGIELEFDRDTVAPQPFESTDEAVEFITTKFGPMIMAQQLTEASGRWPELQAQLAELYERDEPLEYLVILGRKEEQ